MSHIVPPKHFDNKIEITTWIAQFDRYFESQSIRDNHQKCQTVLSRLDPKEVDIVNSYLINRTVGLFSNREISYGELRNSLIKLFGEDGLNETEFQAIFANRAQRTNENIHRYFAALNGLCQKAFLSLSLQDRERMVTTRFINGLTNDNLRRKLLSDYDPNDPKNTLCLADRYNKICNSKQIGETIHAI